MGKRITPGEQDIATQLRTLDQEDGQSIGDICRKGAEEIDRMRLGLANLSVMSPHYSDGKFEDYSSAFARMKQYAKDILFQPSK